MKDDNNTLFNLSTNQNNIISLERALKGTSVNNICTAIVFNGRINTEIIRRAVQYVLERDQSLNIRLSNKNEYVEQYFGNVQDIEIANFNFTGYSTSDFEVWAKSYATKPIFDFDTPLCKFAICKLGEKCAKLMVLTHHIISDGWAQLQICNRICETYLALLNSQKLPEIACPSYRQYVEDQNKYLKSANYERDRIFWENVLSKEFEPADFSGQKNAAIDRVGRRKRFNLPQSLNQKIFRYSMEHRVAPFAVFYMALAVYLKKSGVGERFSIGVPVFNRATYQYKQTTGMFVSTIPFVSNVCTEWTFDEFCANMMGDWLEVLRHQKFPFSEIERIAACDHSLFGIMLSYQDCELIHSTDETVQFSGEWYYAGYQAEPLCIHVTNIEGNRVYTIDYDYLVQACSESQIDTLHNALVNILYECLNKPNSKISEVSLVRFDELEEIAYLYNNKNKKFLENSPYNMLQKHFTENPEKTAIISHRRSITYRELAQSACMIAGALREKGALVAILLPRNEKIFFALTAIMQAGCTWLLLSTELPENRIQKILVDSGAEYIITNAEYANEFWADKITTIDIDSVCDYSDKKTETDALDSAYVVYTSGSTGAPKGVEISGESLCNLAYSMEKYYANRVILSICNVGFDAFVLESIAALLCGNTVVFADDEQKESPVELAELIVQNNVEFIATTPSRLTEMMNFNAFEKALEKLSVIICGGEVFPSDLLTRLRSVTSADIYNQYGPSETTVAVSMCRLNNADKITIGNPMDNCHLYVLDEYLHVLPSGMKGELYIGGICVGKGYRNNPQETERRFLLSPFEYGERLYKTGDIACWNKNGELELFGRADSQVKLRGLRIELEEISNLMESYPGVVRAAVSIVQLENNPILLGYFTTNENVLESDLLVFLASNLPSYMIPYGLMRITEMPLTENGKIDEGKLPKLALISKSKPVNMNQRVILEVFKDVLKTEEIGADSNYFLSGGNSLNAMETILRLESIFHRKLKISELYAFNSAAKLENYFSSNTEAANTSVFVRAPKQSVYPLSDTQMGIYLESLSDQSGFAYHMPCGMWLPDHVDLDRLEKAFNIMINDDPILRSTIAFQNGELQAVVHEKVNIELERIIAEDQDEATRKFLKPFEMTKAPLVHIAYWTCGDNRILLLLDIHHVIGDGLSTTILFKRLDAFYKGETIPEHVSYFDFSWNRKFGKLNENCGQAWENQISGAQTGLDLNTGKKRPERFDFQGENLCYAMGAQSSAAIKTICERYELTDYMLFSGLLGITLAKLSGNSNVTIGTPISQRTENELEKVCGPLVATLPIQMQVSGSFKEFFARVKEMTLFAIEHNNVSLQDLLKKLNIVRQGDRNPLYQVLFQMRPINPNGFEIGGSVMQYVPISTHTSKLDFSMEAAWENGVYTLYTEYASSIYSKDYIEFLCRCLEQIAVDLVEKEIESDISTYTPLSYHDRAELLEKYWYACYPYYNQPIPFVINQVARKNEDKTAIIWHDQKVSFANLMDRAYEIAGILSRNGVVKGDRIGLCCSRTPNLFAALIGIMSIGAVYVPFLGSYPSSRVENMMRIASAKMILCDNEAKHHFDGELDKYSIISLEDAAEPCRKMAQLNGSDAMYILFTSGSSGEPKGVQLPYRALSNLLQFEIEKLNTYKGAILCTTNDTFDIFVTESVLALASGRTVILADEEEMLFPNRIAEIIDHYHPDIAQFTPSRLQLCLRDNRFCEVISNVQYTILVGEAVQPQLVEKFKQVGGKKLGNWYGPTEAAVYVTNTELEVGNTITIGKPMHNCRLYVLDENRNLVLPTAKGELYIGGICLADGYVNREDLTEKAFVDDVFFPGERMYKTGDIGALRLDGDFECYGRNDSQIKINGNRVELQEIEEELLKAGAAQALVIPQRMKDGSTMLIGVVTPMMNEDEIRERLICNLPSYMIPGKIYSMDSFPINASGKIDRNKLIEVYQNEQLEQSVPAKKKDEEEILSVRILSTWEKTLGINNLKRDISFFRQGGSSLTALNVLTEYLSNGWELSLEDFYRYPTVSEQAQILRGKTIKMNVEDVENRIDHLTPIPAYVHKATQALDSKCTVLLTGATGYLGVHILRGLLLKGCNEIICITRDGSKDRLAETISWYFGENFLKRCNDKIQLVPADITKKKLAMESVQYNELTRRVDVVIHCAADVRHYASDEMIWQTNVEGTKNISEFALEANAMLCHISTASVSGDFVESRKSEVCEYTEKDMEIGQNWRENVYISSKIQSESVVYDYINRGLCAKVFRVGRLVGRYTDGVFQKNPKSNVFFRVMKALAKVRAIPYSLAQMRVEITPVDLCAGSILSLCNYEETVFHIIQRYPQTLWRIVSDSIYGIKTVDDSAFLKELEKIGREDPESVSILVDLWNNRQKHKTNVVVSAEATYKALEEVGFVWPSIQGNELEAFSDRSM